MSDDLSPRNGSESPTDRVQRAVAEAEERSWRKDVDEHVGETRARLSALEAVQGKINLHLTAIDTNLAWIVRVMKWIVGPIAAYFGFDHLVGP